MSTDSTSTPRWDPDSAAKPGTGIFGLPEQAPFTPETARVVIIPVPFDATTSYGGGASTGPEAVVAASAQVDLYDTQFGPIYERGIAMLEASPEIIALAPKARAAAEPIIDKGGSDDTADDREAITAVDKACERVNVIVEQAAKAVLARGQVPGLLGGDHSTPFGIIKACAEHAGELGILHLDAHMDLRDAFEGFGCSHASIMHNVISRIPQVTKLVQIGLRDVGKGEVNFAKAHKGRVWPHFDIDWQRELLMARGPVESRGPQAGGFVAPPSRSFRELVADALVPLPKKVYVSFDIDALDPALCPGTGTPVPGGLSFVQACIILEMLRDTKRTVIGFDLVEVSPREGDEWDANVGARMLYKLCGIC